MHLVLFENRTNSMFDRTKTPNLVSTLKLLYKNVDDLVLSFKLHLTPQNTPKSSQVVFLVSKHPPRWKFSLIFKSLFEKIPPYSSCLQPP